MVTDYENWYLRNDDSAFRGLNNKKDFAILISLCILFTMILFYPRTIFPNEIFMVHVDISHHSFNLSQLYCPISNYVFEQWRGKCMSHSPLATCISIILIKQNPLSNSFNMQDVHLSNPLSTPLSIYLKIQGIHLSSPLSIYLDMQVVHLINLLTFALRFTSTRIMISTSTRHIIHYEYNIYNYTNKRVIYLYSSFIPAATHGNPLSYKYVRSL
jgi:hypothetical protein